MYQPIKEEIEEMGFSVTEGYNGLCYTYHKHKTISISYYPIFKNGWEVFLPNSNEFEIFYPQSKSDIETLIRLFTPPNE